MEYRISIIVEGEDRASGPLRNVGSALGNMGQIAGGILGAGLIMNIGNHIKSMATEAIMATANLQQMQVGMEGLFAREIANTSQMEAAAAAEKGIAKNALTIADAMPLAQDKAKAMMEELAKIAMLSPYQMQTVQSTYQTALAFGYSSEQAKGYTQAILNMAAGTGANNEMLGRMSYNFAQIRMQGKVTAMDIRQLAMAGMDLNSVLQYTGKTFGVAIKDHNDFNDAIAKGKITWDQFTTAFQKYAEENFGGASERMSRTLMGLQSTFKDVMVLTMPKILGPATDKMVGFLNNLLNSFLKFRDTGLLEKWGEKLGTAMDTVVKFINPITAGIDEFFTLLAKGTGPIDALKVAIFTAFGLDAVNVFDKFLGAIKDIAGAIGNIVRTVGPKLIEIFQKIGDWFVKNVAPFISFKDVLITLGIVILSSLIPAVAAIIGTLLSAAAPILLILAAVTLLRNAWENNWGGMRDKLTAVWNTTILPALQKLWEWLKINIPIAIAKLSEYWQTTLLPALKTVWNWIVTVLVPLLIRLWDWLKVNIPAAIQALSKFWTGTLLPAIQAVWNWVNDVAIPIILRIYTWFTVDLPAAIQALKTWWDNLLVSIQNIWNYVATTVIGVITTLYTWLSTNLTLAIQTLANFWNNVLLPPLQAVWAFLSGYIFPLFQAIAGFWAAVFNLAITALAGLWQNVLLPAIMAVWTFVSTNVVAGFQIVVDFWSGVFNAAIQTLTDLWNNTLLPALTAVWSFLVISVFPIFQTIADFWNGLFTAALTTISNLWTGTLLPAFQSVSNFITQTLQPAFQTLVNFFTGEFKTKMDDAKTNTIDKVADAFNGIKKAIQWVIDKIKELTDKLKNIKLPTWLQPGSPTPFELGLRGINKELREMAFNSTPRLTSRLNNLGDNPIGSSGQGVIDNRQYNLNLATTQSPAVVTQSFELMKVLNG